MPLAHPGTVVAPHPALSASSHVLPALADAFASPGQFLDSVALLKNPTLFGKAQAFGALRSVASFRAWYGATSPVVSAVAAWFWISIIVWILGELTGNLSQVDRIWTFLPVVASAHFCFYPYFATRSAPIAPKFSFFSSSPNKVTMPQGVDPRMLLVFALQCVWSARLSYNALRRGFFNPKEEDYRWVVLRQRLPKWQIKIINATFIAFTQVALLIVVAAPQCLLLTLRSHPASHTNPLSAADFLLAGLFLATLAVEMAADNQQQRYQRFKRDPAFRASIASQNTHAYRTTAARLDALDASVNRGFLTGGMWSWSRHPNFACEQLTWWWTYCFTIIATLPPAAVKLVLNKLDKADLANLAWWKDLGRIAWLYGVNWSIIAPISMSLLFYSSTLFTEDISASKYPMYKEYQSAVDMFWPVLTPLKSLLLLVTGQRRRVHDRVFGAGAMSGPSADGDRVKVPERRASKKVKDQ